MRIFEWASQIYGMRQSNLKDPISAGFSLFKQVPHQGETIQVMKYETVFPTILHKEGALTNSETKVIYADQNPNGISYEASLVRNGIMKYYHLAWVWLDNPDIGRHWLCKVNHLKGIELLIPRVTSNGIPDNLGNNVEIERSSNILHIAI